ncbi:MAG TPA: response regulator [Opitutaceae bacterium]|nr:response regulator [Opitutaceae bacterium]
MPDATPTEDAPERKSLRILYADDLPGLREVTRLALVADGHAVECVEDGFQARARLEPDLLAFDLVITDHHMPRANGVELVSWLRTVSFPGKILVVTSDLSPPIGDAYRRLHVDRIVYKPTCPSELRETVAALTPA